MAMNSVGVRIFIEGAKPKNELRQEFNMDLIYLR